MEACQRAGCSGVIEDGYCTACGLAPQGQPAAALATPSSRSTRSTRSVPSVRSSTTRRRPSGVILTALPPVPPVDPLSALIPGEVPERKRRCSNCDAKLTRVAGFCPSCGQEYAFRPSLTPGAVVGGKYSVKGTIAFGGLGWIYLAMDTVLNRWVVLKGLLNAKDARQAQAAVQEREFLAAVKHRNIVGIYDCLTHGSEGLIVMEYVNGKSLLGLRRQHGGPLAPLEACSYILELLPAFAYLHQLGLVYCDFKLENAIVEGETVKLIDLGAVRRMDDLGGDVYGTRGYAAPEATDQPSPQADLYTVARALAVLVADFDFQGTHEQDLPAPTEAPVFRQHPSLHRFLLKATRRDPAHRFQTADEMAGQLLGVLRDVAAGQDVLPPVDSTVFEADNELTGDDPRRVPTLLPAPGDPAAGAIAAATLVLDPGARLRLLERAWEAHPDSADLPFHLAAAAIDDGADAEQIKAWVGLAATVDPDGWRAAWLRGSAALAAGDGAEAVNAFDTVVGELPGELAPKVAVAHAYELAKDVESAVGYFDLVSRADPSYTAAAFGLARCRMAQGDPTAAVEALDRVPPSSSRHDAARAAMAEIVIGTDTTAAGIRRAADLLEPLRTRVDTIAVHHLCARVLTAAANVGGGAPPILDAGGSPASLRKAAESELRACARLATSRDDRIRFVDEANRARPLTLV